MKTVLSRSGCVRIAALCSVVLLAVLLVGCQTSGKVLSVSESAKCPMCKTETRTAPIKGLTYKKHICPGCKVVRDTSTWAETADATEVHVCDHCKTAVGACPQCAAK
ncbi:MAG: hypothetical protein HN742_26790 [Lentisphaerae bacterium]|jgi:hypothetical protein|nr:hypothetical protein [Lentisphaerota bacterium]MBT5606193.1 hypothetical protein [Lentisphaerota bacterium]MBT7057724.1 hypothetical protein [Lentisphaerota bacterium]MBT7845510.1 hypothetical protein [Lentisphaerota bacterium]